MSAVGGALAADKAEIVALTPYTTQKVTQELFAVRDALEGAPAPVLAWDAQTVLPMTNAKFAAKSGGVLPAGFTSSLDDWLGVVAAGAKLPDGSDDPDESLPVRAHDKLAAVGTAVFAAPNYLRVRPGSTTTSSTPRSRVTAPASPWSRPRRRRRRSG